MRSFFTIGSGGRLHRAKRSETTPEPQKSIVRAGAGPLQLLGAGLGFSRVSCGVDYRSIQASYFPIYPRRDGEGR